MNTQIEKLNWEKNNGLLPVIIQDHATLQMLMLGYMNEAALQKTVQTNTVTFYSRSKKRLWTKGEVSGNYLRCVSIHVDCDADTLLIYAEPAGVVCHQDKRSCFDPLPQTPSQFLNALTILIDQRKQSSAKESYVAHLHAAGIQKIAKKVGEEAVEVALAAVAENENLFCEEVADLLFHLLVLLSAKNISFETILSVLKKRRVTN